MTVDIAVLEQLASRICHDLISPVGAIGNGLELLAEMGSSDVDNESIKLIDYSSNQAAAKLAAFRLAYGAGGRDPNIKPEDVQKTFGKFIAGDGKIKQAWSPFEPLGIDPKTPVFCKMLMCGLMLAAETLPRGGMILADPGTDNETLITAQGNDAVVRDGVEAALNGTLPSADMDPRMVHPVMTALMAKKYGYNVGIHDKTDGKVVISLKYKG